MFIVYTVQCYLFLKFFNTHVDIRLLQGTDATEGILEIYEDNKWGIVCNDTFNHFAATIMCRKLRFGLPVQYRGNSFIRKSEAHYVYCSSTSQSFSHCFNYISYFTSCYETFLKCSSNH